MFSVVRSGGNDTSGTWHGSQNEREGVVRAVVESLASLLLPSSDQSQQVGLFMRPWLAVVNLIFAHAYTPKKQQQLQKNQTIANIWINVSPGLSSYHGQDAVDGRS